MITFGTAITDLLDCINRPVIEAGPSAAREVNNTIAWMQRKHLFKYSERLVKIVYPANALAVDLSIAADGIPRDLMSVQLLSGPDANSGTPLRIKSYDEIMREKHKSVRRNSSSYAEIDDPITLGTYVSETHTYYVFLVNNKIGLFPTPTSDVNLMLSIHVWLPRMVDPDDTNFFLEFCYDFVILKALSKLNLCYKVDVRYPVTNDELNDLWDTVSRWDGTIGNTPGETT